MGKLRMFTGREICAILEEHGFVEVRQRGSHIIMQAQTADGTITIPVPNYTEVRKGTLSSIIRQSGLPRNLFE